MTASTTTDIAATFARDELARRRLVDFAQLMDRRWLPARHLTLIAQHLEAIERREIDRLAICMPPRHGKTQLVSRLFVAWYLGRHPEHHAILASYGTELAEGNSRFVRTSIRSDEYPFDVAIREDSAAAGRWETTQGGVCVAVGCGSGLTGRGGELIVCDDLVKDRQDAESELIRKSTAEWFSDVLLTRANPEAAIVMIGTRWHEDDVLASAFVGEAASRWTKLVLPLLAEENDPLGRQEGQLLWPERFSESDFPSAERGEISSRSFAALYQQRPTPAAGNVFRRDWFTNRYRGGVPRIRTEIESTNQWLAGSTEIVETNADLYVAVDCASKTGISNDYSAIVVIGTDGKNYYIVDVVQERLEFPQLIARIKDVAARWSPRLIFIEEASAGIPIVQVLKSGTNLPVVGCPVKGSKEARADAVTPLFESMRVYFPERAPWFDKYVDELCAFPAGRHDDMVDATVLGIDMVSQAIHRKKQSQNIARFAGWYWKH